MRTLWIAVATVCIAKCHSQGVWCKDPEGNNVEWSLIYKVPHVLSESTSKNLNTDQKTREGDGSAYGYIDSRMVADGQTGFSSGAAGIFSAEKNPLANSLEPLFKWDKTKADQELVYIAYNDQPPENGTQASEWSTGHTKGVILFDSTSGLWLVHSVPKFPDNMFSGQYSFPKNGHVNGQTLLCMTFKIGSLNTIAGHLLNQKPVIFKANAPEKIAKGMPDLVELLRNASNHNEQKVIKSVLRGIHGMPFLAFAKSGLLDEDVYSKSIAPALGSDLYVSSWLNGEGGRLGPECSLKFKVLDVESVSFTFGKSKTAWLTRHDHAKWALSRNDSKWLCIGSINRMHSQFKRGGETVCLAEEVLGKLFQNAITNHTTCGNYRSQANPARM